MVILNAEMQQVQVMLEEALSLLKKIAKPIYFVYDGAFGNNAAAHMAQTVGLHLISKLKKNSALFYPNTEEYSGHGRPKKYGSRIDYKNIDSQYLLSVKLQNNVKTSLYQIESLHRKFSKSINLVVLVEEDLLHQKSRHTLFFSTDLELAADKLVDYYRLRFQIEFNFRSAKQYWGLEDFMNIKKDSVYNAANFSMFMVNVSQLLLQDYPHQSTLDLKSHHHGVFYAKKIFNILPKTPQAINNDRYLEDIPIFGLIHQR
jgi:putative transposase